MPPFFKEFQYNLLIDDSRTRRPRYVTLIRHIGAALLVTLLLILVGFHFFGPYSGHLVATRGPDIDLPEIPKDFQTVAVVFYGRRSRVEILDCYLKQNLKENGGLLDEVIFLTRTEDKDDLEWLDRLIPTSKSYRKAIGVGGFKFGLAWDAKIFERGKMYLKIDDDVVFIDNNTVPELITMKRDHPEYFIVSANSVNQPAFSWVHWHLGAVHPYLPELSPPRGLPSPSWRASELPKWNDSASFNRREWFSPPYKNHRWLPLGPKAPLDGTPITTATYDKVGPGWDNWAVAAQQHYSFLENLEKNELWRYNFDTWDFEYERLSINMIAIWGDDVVDNIPFPKDDEQYVTRILPKKLGRHAVMNGHAIAAHFSFSAQRRHSKGMEWTDVLARYKAYADEKVCRR